MSGGKSLLNKGRSKLPPPSEEICGYLGKGAAFKGKMTFEGIFRLEGRFEGEIFESGTLIVGEMAAIKGKIETSTIIINGHVEGEVYAKERIEIHPTGKLYGNLLTPTLIINEGGNFNGHCKMEEKVNKENDLHTPDRSVDQSLSN